MRKFGQSRTPVPTAPECTTGVIARVDSQKMPVLATLECTTGVIARVDSQKMPVLATLECTTGVIADRVVEGADPYNTYIA